MATINGSTNSSNWTYKLDVTETSTSLANKTSTVRVRVYLGRANSQSYLGGDYKVTVNCGGQSQSFNGNISYPTYINADSWLLLKTFTFTVPNTGNPTKTSISSSMSSSDFTPSSASASGSMNLTVLHLAPEITNVTITETNTLMDLLGIKDDNIAQHLSKKKFLIETTTYDEATIDNYSIYHNNVLIGTSKTHEVEVDFSNVGELITAISNNKYYTGLTIAVTDNLGGYTTKMYNYEVTKYTKPTYENATTNIKRQTGNGIVLTDNKAILSFIGTYYGNNDVLGNNNKPK